MYQIESIKVYDNKSWICPKCKCVLNTDPFRKKVFCSCTEKFHKLTLHVQMKPI